MVHLLFPEPQVGGDEADYGGGYIPRQHQKEDISPFAFAAAGSTLWIQSGEGYMRALRTILLLVLLSTATGASAQSAPSAGQIQSSGGRYQILMNPELARNTFLLDTVTGRVWALMSYAFLKNEPRIWTLMDRVDAEADEERVVAKYGLKPDDKSTTPAK
jgi:hypothetical protein